MPFSKKLTFQPCVKILTQVHLDSFGDVNATRFCDSNGVGEPNASCAFKVLDLEDVSIPSAGVASRLKLADDIMFALRCQEGRAKWCACLHIRADDHARVHVGCLLQNGSHKLVEIAG